MKKLISFVLIYIFALSFATAHRGKTDAQGGHYDYENESGLGSYHYHHGYSAHLHENGVCPYASSAPAEPEPQQEEPTTPTITTSNIETTTEAEIDLNGVKQAAYQEGYKKGVTDTQEEFRTDEQDNPIVNVVVIIIFVLDIIAIAFIIYVLQQLSLKLYDNHPCLISEIIMNLLYILTVITIIPNLILILMAYFAKWARERK